MSLKNLMAGLSLCLSSYTLLAATITGIIADENGEPIEFANVSMLAMSDSALIDGTVTDMDGRFALTEIPSPCFLRISALGYEEKRIDNPHGDLGHVAIEHSTFELGEVVVKGRRSIAKLKNGCIQVVVSGTYLANAGTALDVLGKMPFVSKNGATLEVFGKGTPIVFINGRQVRDESELDQLSSADIKNVDIITSPGARYDSSVNAVIRITTIAPVGEGFSFNDRTTAGYKHYGYLFEQLNLNYRRKGFDIFGYMNYENYRERTQVWNNKSLYLKSGTISQSCYSQDFTKYPVYEGKVGLNYNSTNQYAGFYYDFAYRPATGSSSSFTSRLLDSVLEDELTYNGANRKHNRQHLASAYYCSTWSSWQISANFDAMWQFNDLATNETELSVFNPARAFITNNEVTNRMLAGNISATLPLWKGSLQFGTEFYEIHRKDLYSSDAEYIQDTDTKIKETTAAMFADFTQTFGKVSVAAGLRWEYTDSQYFIWNVIEEDQSRKYHNFAPNVSLSFPIENVSTNISYARKTTRPAFEQLRSSIRYLDRYSYEAGNPNLKPIYRDYLTISGAWRNLIVELNWVKTKNYFMWQTLPYPCNPDATLLRMENMPGYNTIEAFANYSPSFSSIWRPTFLAGVMAQDFKLLHNGLVKELNNPVGIFRFNNAIHLPWDIWLNADFSAQTSGNSDNVYMKSRWNCDLGLYKSFSNDTWSIKLQLNDVFNSYRQQFTNYDALTAITVDKIYDSRDLSLTIRYNFNPAQSRFKGHGVANTEKDRF